MNAKAEDSLGHEGETGVSEGKLTRKCLGRIIIKTSEKKGEKGRHEKCQAACDLEFYHSRSRNGGRRDMRKGKK